MGGDVEMLAMIGAFSDGSWCWSRSCCHRLGSLIGVLVIAIKRGGMKHALPYGTFWRSARSRLPWSGTAFSRGLGICDY